MRTSRITSGLRCPTKWGMVSSASASAATPTTREKSTALEKSIDTHAGSFAAQYRCACVRPQVASSATTGGHNITISKSPRPAGPSAQALSRLVSTPHSRASALVLNTIFMFRLNMRLRLRLPPSEWLELFAREFCSPEPATSDRCIRGQVASTLQTKDCCDLRLATNMSSRASR
jgi:hypothetical protein